MGMSGTLSSTRRMVQLKESDKTLESEALDLNDCVDEQTFNMLEEERERKEILGSLLDFFRRRAV